MPIRKWVASWLGGFLAVSLVPSVTIAAPIYRNLGHQVVTGQWAQQPDGTYRVQPGTFNLDINQDARSDMQFEHGYRRPLLYFAQNEAELIKTAHAGITDSLETVKQMRPLALRAAMGGVNDPALYRELQVSIESALEHLDRMGDHWSFQGRPLLDGTLGVTGTSSDPNIAQVVRTTSDTWRGGYAVNVTQSARRAVVKAPVSQQMNLAQDEILSINDANIPLRANMSQNDVIDRINESSGQTGLRADVDGQYSRVYSLNWGSDAYLNMVANKKALEDTSGFGDVYISSSGEDARISIGGDEMTGKGRLVTVSSGLAKGLSLLLSEDFVDPTSTVAQDSEFTVTVVDQSLDLLLLPAAMDAHVRVSVPSVHPNSLALGLEDHSFKSLNEIRVLTPNQARDSLGILDAAAGELRESQHQLELLLDRYHTPQGQAFVSLENSAAGNAFAFALDPLSEGQLVNQDTPFSVSPLNIEQLVPDDPAIHSLFIGFRFTQNVDTHYGWMRLSVDEQRRVTLEDLAYEATPDRGIRIAYVPEPSMVGFAVATLLLIASRARSSRHCRFV